MAQADVLMRPDAAQIIARKRSGWTWRRIADELGRSVPSVRMAYRRYGHKPEYADVSSLSLLTAPPGEGYMEPAYVPTVAPKGWEKGVTLEGNRGTIATGATSRDPNWDAVLKHFRFDPALFEIVEPFHVRTWDAAIGNGKVRRMWYHRANIIRRRSADDKVDVEQLATEIREHEPAPARPGGDLALVVLDSDWQLGKRDGDGTQGVVRRVLDSTDELAYRAAELRQIGRKLGTLYLVGMGDLVEGCDGYYAMQTFSVELDRRQQVKVARRLVLHQLRVLAPLFDRVVVACVPGNHGENRKNGKAYTSWGDNDDVALFEQVAEILGENEAAYAHVSFVIPSDELSLTLNVGGTNVAFAHGHQAKGGPAGVERWWRNQAFGQQAAGSADILVTAHYHHLVVKRDGPRTWMQCPALESESTWYKQTSGKATAPGVLTFAVGPDGWQDMEVL